MGTPTGTRRKSPRVSDAPRTDGRSKILQNRNGRPGSSCCRRLSTSTSKLPRTRVFWRLNSSTTGTSVKMSFIPPPPPRGKKGGGISFPLFFLTFLFFCLLFIFFGIINNDLGGYLC